MNKILNAIWIAILIGLVVGISFQTNLMRQTENSELPEELRFLDGRKYEGFEYALGSPYETEKTVDYIIAQVNTYTYMLNGTTGRMDGYSTNETLIQEWANGNLTSGTIHLKEVQWNTSITIGANILVIEDYQGTRKFYGNLDTNQNQIMNMVFWSGTSFPSNPVEGQPFWRTDEHTLYIYTGAFWQSVQWTGSAPPPSGERMLGFAVSGTEMWEGTWASADFAVINDTWGFDYILVEAWWGKLESEAGVYNDARINALRSSVDDAIAEGLKVILSLRVCYSPTTGASWWTDWTGANPNHDYVNLNATGGLDRYIDFLEYMVSNFTDCDYCLWHFPYHSQGGLSDTQKNTFYDTTMPAMISAVRGISNNTIVFVPIYQGMSNNGEFATYYETAEPLDYEDINITYGLGHMMPWSVIDGDDWDYDTTELNQAFQGVSIFRETYNASMMSVEFTPIQWNGEGLDQSRLDCLEEILIRMETYDVGWTYWRVSQASGETGDNLIRNSDMAQVQADILALLQEYD